MKKFSRMTFIIVYLLFNSGITLAAHYCCGKVDASIELNSYIPENPSCCTEKDDHCVSHDEEKCSIFECSTVLIPLKLNDNQISEKSRNLLELQILPISVPGSVLNNYCPQSVYFIQTEISSFASYIYLTNRTLLI